MDLTASRPAGQILWKGISPPLLLNSNRAYCRGSQWGNHRSARIRFRDPHAAVVTIAVKTPCGMWTGGWKIRNNYINMKVGHLKVTFMVTFGSCFWHKWFLGEIFWLHSAPLIKVAKKQVNVGGAILGLMGQRLWHLFTWEVLTVEKNWHIDVLTGVCVYI